MDVVMYRTIVRYLKGSMLVSLYEVMEQKIRKLQKFGGGYALYLSADEVKDFLGGNIFVKVLFCKKNNGKSN